MATERRFPSRWLLTCALAVAAASPAAAQTGGFARPALTTGTRPGATTAGQGAGATDMGSVVDWDEVAAVAEELAVMLGIEFEAPWEEGLWTLLVARFVLDIDLSALVGSGGDTGRSAHSDRPPMGGTGGFGGGARLGQTGTGPGR